MLRCSKAGPFRDSPTIGLDSETKRLTFAHILQNLATPSGHQAISVQHIGSPLIVEIIAGEMMVLDDTRTSLDRQPQRCRIAHPDALAGMETALMPLYHLLFHTSSRNHGVYWSEANLKRE